LILADRQPAPAKFAALAETVAKMKALAAEAAANNSPEHYADAHSRFTLLDADFHQHLIECAGNEALERTWNSVAPVDLLFVYDLVAIRNGTVSHLDLKPIVDQHVRLLTYIRDGDRAEAERELKAQFTRPNRAHSIHLNEMSLSVLGW
jgi:DNA-binding GntR family transcriptional regulator